MDRAITYDMTRLLCGMWTATPNGIDRVDLCFAEHFLRSARHNLGAVVLNKICPWWIGPQAARAALDCVEAHWRETTDVDNDLAYGQVRKAVILGAGDCSKPQWIVSSRAHGKRDLVRILAALLPTFPRIASLPKAGFFIHVTQFPFVSMFRWLDRRPKMKAVFFIHDLLPMQYPEYFTAQNCEWHRRSLDVLVRYGSAAIVNGVEVKNALQAYLTKMNRPAMPVFVAPIPANSAFYRSPPVDKELAATPYFVIVGTIEPRKNHFLILNVWRDLARKYGEQTPKLIIIGKRGWKNSNVLRVLQRSRALRPHVIEASGLSTPAMKSLIANARALLIPSFAEGYCLPMVEALALGTSVIASDIQVFREVGGSRCVYRSPIDGKGWISAILDHLHAAPAPHRAPETSDDEAPMREYFAKIDEFFATIDH